MIKALRALRVNRESTFYIYKCRPQNITAKDAKKKREVRKEKKVKERSDKSFARFAC